MISMNEEIKISQIWTDFGEVLFLENYWSLFLEPEATNYIS